MLGAATVRRPSGGTDRRTRLPWWRIRRRGVALLYLFPMLGAMALFVYYPIVQGVLYSFQRVNFIDPPEWAGWANFEKVIADPVFGQAWVNTLQFTALLIVFGQVLPLVMAMMMKEIRWGRPFFQLAAYLPTALPPVVAAMLWNWMYDPGLGFLNSLLRLFGIGKQAWLLDQDQVLFSIVAIIVWGGWGFAALIYLAALQSIPTELYDAAEIDGANVRQRVRYVTLPHLRGLILVLIILGVIGSMQLFTEPFVLTAGGPDNATVTVVMLVYRYAFQFGDVGAASALGLMLMLFLGVFSIFYWWVTRRLSTP